jgi:hypothetical protein
VATLGGWRVRVEMDRIRHAESSRPTHSYTMQQHQSMHCIAFIFLHGALVNPNVAYLCLNRAPGWESSQVGPHGMAFLYVTSEVLNRVGCTSQRVGR